MPRVPHSDAFVRICRLAGRAVNRYRMILSGDRIVVGVSGGWDSLILIEILYHLQRRSPVPFELFPAVVDMGFRTLDASALAAFFRERKRPLEILPVAGPELLRKHNAEARPCSLCSRLRRGRLHAYADTVQANVIALGHQLDDLCASFLMSLFRGGGLKTMGPHVSADSGSKRLIRPLCLVSRRLIVEAARDLRLPRFGECDYHDQVRERGDREFMKRLLDDLDQRFPGVRHAMLRSLSDVRPAHLLDVRFLTVPPDATARSHTSDDAPSADRAPSIE